LVQDGDKPFEVKYLYPTGDRSDKVTALSFPQLLIRDKHEGFSIVSRDAPEVPAKLRAYIVERLLPAREVNRHDPEQAIASRQCVGPAILPAERVDRIDICEPLGKEYLVREPL